MKTVTYRCTKVGHIAILRLTKQRPEPDRWEGDACGFCLREGIEDSVLSASS